MLLQRVAKHNVDAHKHHNKHDLPLERQPLIEKLEGQMWQVSAAAPVLVRTTRSPRHVQPVAEHAEHERKSHVRVDGHIEAGNDENYEESVEVLVPRDVWLHIVPCLPHNKLEREIITYSVERAQYS